MQVGPFLDKQHLHPTGGMKTFCLDLVAIQGSKSGLNSPYKMHIWNAIYERTYITHSASTEAVCACLKSRLVSTFSTLAAIQSTLSMLDVCSNSQ